MDVAKAHQLSIARRKGEWEFVETPDLKQAKQEIEKLRGALHILSKPFPGHERLTPRERVALSQNKQGGRSLARRQPTHRRVSPRQHHAEARCKKTRSTSCARCSRRMHLTTPRECVDTPQCGGRSAALESYECCEGNRGRARAEKPVAVTRAEGTANRSSPCPKCRTEKIQKLTPVMVE